MNNEDCNDRDASIASYLADDPDFAKDVVERALNAVLEGEMTELLGVAKGERSRAPPTESLFTMSFHHYL